MKRRKEISAQPPVFCGIFLSFLCIFSIETGIATAQDTLNFNDLPRDPISRLTPGIKSPADSTPLLNPPKGSLETLFGAGNTGTRKPSWSGLVRTSPAPPPPPEWELVPGEGEAASTPTPKVRATALASQQQITTTTSPQILDTDPPQSNSEKTSEIFAPPPFENIPINKPPEATPAAPRQNSQANSPAADTAKNAAPVIRSEAVRNQGGPPAPVQPSPKIPSPQPPAAAQPSPKAPSPQLPAAAQPLPNTNRGTPVPPVPVPTTTETASVADATSAPENIESTISSSATIPATNGTKESDDDYHAPPDVYPFTVPSDELIGKTPELPAPATIDPPRPPPQAFDPRSAFFASNWAAWSPWSQCQSNEKVRVRACNTVRGFTCFGKNKESQPCEVTTTLDPTFPPTLPGFAPVDPGNPFGDLAPIDKAAEFGEEPGGRRVFVLKQPPGFGVPHAAPAAAPADYADYGAPSDDSQLAPSSSSSQNRQSPTDLQFQSQAKFQQKVEEIGNSDNSNPKSKGTKATTKSTSTKAPSKSTTPKPQGSTPDRAKAQVRFHSQSKNGSEEGKFGGSVSAPANQKSMQMHTRPDEELQPFEGKARRPSSSVRVAQPQDAAADQADTTEATTSEQTTRQLNVDLGGGDTSTDTSTTSTTSANPPAPAPPPPAPPPPPGPSEGGTPPKVRPSGYTPNSPGDFGGGADLSPPSSYQGPSPPNPYGGGGQAPQRPQRPSVPTGFDQAMWGNWGPWGPCTCGKRARTRACDYSTAYLTEGCDGNSYELQPCSGAPCGTQICGPTGCGGGGGGYGGGGCSGGGCVLQGGPSGGGGCPGGACGGGGPVLVKPPFPYPPVPPGGGGCPGGQCALQGGPSSGCGSGGCGSPGGYGAPPPPPPPPAPYGQPSGCSGGGCALQGGPPSGGCPGGGCNPSPPILPPIVGGGGGCSGGGCGQPASGYGAPSPPAGGCSGSGCVLQGGSGPIGIKPPTVPSGGGGYASSGSGCSGGGCNLQGGGGGTGCTGGDCVLSGASGSIMIKPGGTGGGCSGGGCGGGGYAPPPPPPPPSGYGGGGCAGGGCALQGGPPGGSGGCGAGGCAPILPPIVASAPAPAGYGSSGGCGSGGCGAPAPAPAPAGYGSSGGCSGGGCELQGGAGGCSGGGCAAPAPSGCGSGSYGSPGCQTPPSAVGAQYKTLPPVENIRMDGVVQPIAFTAPPGVIATTPGPYGAPAYGAPAPSYGGSPSSYSGRRRQDEAPSVWKQKAGSLVEAELDDDKSAPERTRRKRRIAIHR